MADAITTAPLVVEAVPLDQLIPDPRNPRHINDAAYERLKAGVRAFGLVDPIIARRADGRVVGGHQRLRVARDLGLPAVPVVWVDLDDAHADALAVLLNNPNAQGDWDLAQLIAMVEPLDAALFPLTGFDDSSWAAVIEGGPYLGGVPTEADWAAAFDRGLPDDALDVVHLAFSLRHADLAVVVATLAAIDPNKNAALVKLCHQSQG